MNNIDQQIQYYENLLSQYGDNYLSLDWKSKDSQEARFRVFEDLINMISPKSFSVLDVGCGFGDFYNYLAQKGHHFTYKGVDLSQKIIDMARLKNNKAKFEVKDILTVNENNSYDFVFLCGALNICFTDYKTHMDYIISMLAKMFSLCRLAVGVNFLSSQAIYHLDERDLIHKQYFYAKPEELVVIAKGLTDQFIIRHEYNPGDFTLYLVK